MLLALLLAAAAGDGPWVSQWVRGDAPAPGMMKGFHSQFPASPHAEDSLAYEALRRTRQVVAGQGSSPAALRADAEKVLGNPKAGPEARGRAAKVLGWLQAPETIPALERAATAGELNAVQALGFFGDRGARDGYLVFGGTPAFEQFDPRPEPAAARALLGLVHHANPEVRREALRQLELFDGSEVDQAWADAARTCSEPRALKWLETHALPDRLDTLQRCAKSAEGEVRAAAVRALGEAGGRAVIPQLLAALGDPEDAVFLSAHRALSRLEGFEGVPPEASVKDRGLLVPLWKQRLAKAR